MGVMRWLAVLERAWSAAASSLRKLGQHERGVGEHGFAAKSFRVSRGLKQER